MAAMIQVVTSGRLDGELIGTQRSELPESGFGFRNEDGEVVELEPPTPGAETQELDQMFSSGMLEGSQQQADMTLEPIGGAELGIGTWTPVLPEGIAESAYFQAQAIDVERIAQGFMVGLGIFAALGLGGVVLIILGIIGMGRRRAQPAE